MFLFKFFDTFSNDFANGFADGFSFMIIFRLIGGCIAWHKRCNQLHKDMCRFYDMFNEKADVAEYEFFTNYIYNCWVLDAKTQTDLVWTLRPVRTFARQPFQSNIPAYENALADFKARILRHNFLPGSIFKKHPVKTVAQWLMYSTAIHN